MPAALAAHRQICNGHAEFARERRSARHRLHPLAEEVHVQVGRRDEIGPLVGVDVVDLLLVLVRIGVADEVLALDVAVAPAALVLLRI